MSETKVRWEKGVLASGFRLTWFTSLGLLTSKMTVGEFICEITQSISSHLRTVSAFRSVE